LPQRRRWVMNEGGREAHTQKGRWHGRNAVDWEAKEKTEKRNSGFCLVVWLNELCPEGVCGR